MSKHLLAGVLTFFAVAAAPADAETVQAGSPPVPNLQLRPPEAPHGPGGWHRGGQSWWNGGYRAPVRGYYIPSFWLNRYYWVDNWSGYGFARPGPGTYWVRYYDDAVLVDDRGLIHDSVHGVDWRKADRGPVPVYVGRGIGEAGAPGAAYELEDDRVTGGTPHSCCTGASYTINAQPGSVITLPAGSVTTISFQSAPAVTTETTYYYDKPHRAYTVPKSRYKPKRRAAPAMHCGCR